MRRFVLFAVLAAIVCFATAVLADTIVLRDGSKIEGKILEEGTAGVKILTKYGAITINRRSITKIIKETPDSAEYAEKAKGLAKEHVELAEWCTEKGLEEEAQSHYELALKFDEENKAARKALGYIKKDDKWVKGTGQAEKEEEPEKKEEEAKKEEEKEEKPAERLTREEYARLHQESLTKLQAGEYEEAEKLLNKIIKAVPNDRIALYNMACLYSLTKKKDKAMVFLKMAVKAGFTDTAHMKQDTDLDNIREEEEFKKLIEELIKSSKENMLDWMGDYDEALKKAKEEKKYVFLNFGGKGCGWCTRLDQTTFQDTSVREYLKDFVIVKLDSRAHRELAQKFKVRGIPAMFVVDAEGNQVGSIVGYRDAEKFLQALKDIMED
jgi:thioredoxin-related protein